jgi:hypothetical protein
MHLRLRTALAALIVSLLASIAGLFGAQPAQAAANCPQHYWCGFADTSWGGAHFSWSTGDQGGGYCATLPATLGGPPPAPVYPGWQNRFSSIDNDSVDTDHPIMLFRTTSCGGSHYTVNAGQEIAALPVDWDNAVVAFIY